MNLAEVVLERAEMQSDEPAYSFLSEGSAPHQLTFGELEASARRVAVELAANGVAVADRVLLLYKPGLDFIVAFLGCQLAGAVAVPVYPPRKPEEWPRFAAIALDCRASALCTQKELAPLVAMGLASTPGLERLALVASDALPARDPGGFVVPSYGPERLAFLQYTSGSTGSPKGVMVSHGNLLHNEALIQEGMGNGPAITRTVNWLPQYHDMGLVSAILQPLYYGGLSVLMSPLDFLQQPLRWLQAIQAHRANVSGGPNFAYELCLSRVPEAALDTLDLSSWTLAYNGAEPIRRATLDRFAARFARCGFHRDAFFSCYGLAESTVFVSCSKPGRAPRIVDVDAAALERHAFVPTEAGRPIVSCGHVIGQTVRIVDPETRRECPEGAVGEIWVQGDSVAQGYWNQPEATRETFGAELAGADAAKGAHLRTGDLGTVVDGELYVTGRLKELVIVDGKNHYPQDLEATVQAGRRMLRSGCAAAFSVDEAGGERLVIVQEVVKTAVAEGVDYERLAAEVRQAVAEGHGLALHELVLVPERTVQKTSSGKLRRRHAREQYLAEKLPVLWRSRAAGAPGAGAAAATAPVAAAAAAPAPAAAAATAPAAAAAAATAPAAPSAPSPVATISLAAAERLVASLVAEKLGIAVADVDRHAAFSSFGLDSLTLVVFTGELETRLARRLSPQLFYNYGTVAELARYLVADGPAAAPAAPSAPAAPRHEPIAIVGMACRLPGAPDLDAFWELLRAGRDAIRTVPPERWNADAWYDPDPSTPGKMTTRAGGFIDDVDRFDAEFFGISPREADAMDPQQRLLLELAWHALEDAGVRPETLRGSRTGVFVGVSGSDYARLQAGTPGLASAHAGTGNALSIVANRLSYVFDLRGPSLAIDTACSSSLTAIHQAVTEMAAGGCDAALVAGVNLVLAPDLTVSFSQNRMMAPDGRCKAFGAGADGYGRGEGAGVVVLKRLSDALAAGDRVWAVIHGSACNQDGRSNGLTAPNGLAQQAVVREALGRAGWQPAEVQLVETHGTGTRLGDPIEAEALGAVYGAGRAADTPLVLGALKSQIGHLEAAAGIAGLIKTALCLHHGEIVGNLHADAPNPLVRLDDWRLTLPRANAPWPAAPGRARRAGVSAFGFGGANAHVLLAAAPTVPTPPVDASPRRHVLALSARTPAALARLADAYAERLAAPGVDVAALCHEAAAHRRAFREARLAVHGADAAELLAGLARRRDDARGATATRPLPAGVALLFTGQGAQRLDMGRRLAERHPVLRETLAACDALLRPHREHALLDVLYPAAADADRAAALLGRADYAQPALFALEVGLARLWLSLGVTPSVLMGHSLGEIAAATVAGVLSLEDGLALVEARGRLMHGLAEPGGMLAVFAHERDVAEVLERFAGRLAIGAFNGPGQLVLSGAEAELEKARLALQQRGLETRKLSVTHAFHSPLLEPMVDALGAAAAKLRYHEPRVPILSNLTGKLETRRLASPDYWVAHVTAPVRFAEGVAELRRLDVGTLLEIGPRPVLLAMARRMLPSEDFRFLASLDPAQDDETCFAGSAAALHEAGVDLEGLAPAAGARTAAPLYPFERQRHWFAAPAATAVAHATPAAHQHHPLLGRPLSSPRLAAGARHFEGELRLPGPAFFPVPVEPAERRTSMLAFFEMALAAQQQMFPGARRRLRELRLDGFVRVGKNEAVRVHTLCEPDGADDVRLEIWSEDEPDAWRRVAQGRLAGGDGFEAPAEPLELLRERIADELDVAAWYESTRASGLEYCASPHPAIRRLFWAPQEVLAELTPRDEDDPRSAQLWLRHSLWHACYQVLGAVCPRDGFGTYFPVELRQARFDAPLGRGLVLHARLRHHQTTTPTCLVDVTAYAEDGTPVAVIEDIRLIPDGTVHTPRAEWRRTRAGERRALLTRVLRRIVARALQVGPDELPTAQPLTALGIDSLAIVEVVTKIEHAFELSFDMTSMHRGASVEALAAELDEELARAESGAARPAAGPASPLVELSRGDASIAPLFLVHPVGGSVLCYQELARHLGTQPIVAVQSPTFAGRRHDFTSLEALAGFYVEHLRARQPSGPYRLGGWSMGGVLAFEMTRQLEDAGEEVECLLLLDAPAPGSVPRAPTQGYVLGLMAQSLGIRLGQAAEDDLDAAPEQAIEALLRRARAQHPGLAALTATELRQLMAELERNLALLGRYEPRPCPATATVLRAESTALGGGVEATGRDWERWLAGIDALHTLPGDHFSFLTGSRLTLTASHLRRALKALGRDGEAAHVAHALTLTHARPPEQVVIESARRAPDGTLAAELRVDEAHPYFFDHPLDHVSGILMVEGLLQLAEAGRVAQGGWLRHLRLTFPRFCEKERPTRLELVAGRDDRLAGRVLQGGLPVCTMKASVASGTPAPGAPAGASALPMPADARLLHKRRAENVLVGAWRVDAGVASVALLEPPPGHQLAGGDPRQHSPLYVLEATRQLVTGLVHEVYGVPLGMAMNLVGVDLVLEAPPPRGAPFTLVHRLEPLAPAGASTFAHFTTELRLGDEPCGHVRLTAQLLTRDLYQRVRHAQPDARHQEAVHP